MLVAAYSAALSPMRWAVRLRGKLGQSIALYAARFIDRLPFNEVIRNAIEAGGDTDTVASITRTNRGRTDRRRTNPARVD